ncbi:MAG: hypothetical protein PVG20_02445 [Thioalkalispiraceae bacterium]|jgi:hypothetical protein
MKKVPSQGSKVLELTMRDAMDGLADSATYFAYRSNPDVLEILSIEPAKTLNFDKKPAKVVHVRPGPDIAEYLIQRELELERVSSNCP